MTDRDRYITRDQEEMRPVFICDYCGQPVYPGETYIIDDGIKKCGNCVEIKEASEDDYEEI